MHPLISARRFLLKQLLRTDRSFSLVQTCQRYVDSSRGQNNSDMRTNGELHVFELTAQLFPNAIIMDVGANVGDWASAMLSVHKNCRIHCFEPHPATFDHLRRNLGDQPRAILHNIGLSDSPGTSTLYNVSIDSGMSSLHRRESALDSHALEELPPVSIALDTVDAFLTRDKVDLVHLLKIDTEGNEPRTLLGAATALAKKQIRMIQFEYGGTWIDSRSFLLDTWHLLERNGFHVYSIRPDGFRHHQSYHPQLENFQYSNYLALEAHLAIPETLRS